MLPQEVMKKAAEKGIKMLAICDHNSCDNVASFMAAGERHSISVLPGIEICTKEEAHILGLFGNLESALKLQKMVYEKLEGFNDAETFGLQVLVDEEGEYIGINEKLLIGSIDLSIERVVEVIHSMSGIAVASHIDREAFSIVGQLGFIPEHLKLDAVELSKHVRRDEYKKWQEEYRRFPILSSSDAHFLEEIGQGFTKFRIEEPNFNELKKAISKKDGREITN